MESLIDPALIRGVADLYGHRNSLSLKEHDPTAFLRELVITDVPIGGLICDLDPVEGIGAGKKTRLKRYSWFFRTEHELAPKQCDGALILSVGGVEHLVLLELKSSAAALGKAKKQLRSGRAFAASAIALLERPFKVCTRVIYIGPPLPAPAYAGPARVSVHREITVSATSGRAYISLHELLR